VNTKLLDYVPENKIRVRMSLMPEKMRELKRYQSYNKRVQFLEKLFQAGYSTHIKSTIYHDKKLSGYKELFNIINNEVSEEFKKQAGLECIFLTHNANLHKINLEKAFKARRNTLDTREPRTENQSVWRLKPAVQSTCKASFN
jgi:spore photoproduct lyase